MAEKPRILLIEDNPDDADLARLAIELSGVSCDVQVARDGAEALNLLLGPPGGTSQPSERQPHLVILDLKMPKISGLEVLGAMRANPSTAHIPVVVLTSSSEPRDLADAYDLGANGYVRKPIDVEEFNKAMSCVCSFWLQWNLIPSDDAEV